MNRGFLALACCPRVWAAACIAAVMVIVSAAWHAVVAERALLELHRAESNGDAQPMSAVRRLADFTEALASAGRPAEFNLARIERATRLAGIELVSVAVVEHGASRADLGRSDFSVELRGAYGATKQAIAHLLSMPGVATVRSLRMQVDPASTYVTTTCVVAVWHGPLRAGDSGQPVRHEAR